MIFYLWFTNSKNFHCQQICNKQQQKNQVLIIRCWFGHEVIFTNLVKMIFQIAIFINQNSFQFNLFCWIFVVIEQPDKKLKEQWLWRLFKSTWHGLKWKFSEEMKQFWQNVAILNYTPFLQHFVERNDVYKIE